MKHSVAVTFAGLVAIASLSAVRAETSVQDIRISPYADHVRVVFDLNAPVIFTAAGPNAFELHGLAGGSAVMNAEPKDAPLNRVVLATDGENTKLSFEVSAGVTAKAFLLHPDADGGHRLVVDLYKDDGAAASLSAATPIAVDSASAPAGLAAAPPSNSFAAVPPSNPPQVAPPPLPEPIKPQVPIALATVSSPSAMQPPADAPKDASVTTPIAPPVAAPDTSNVLAANATPEDRSLFAERALDRGDAGAACAASDEVLRGSPHDLRALAVLGGCRLALGDALGARAAFATALEGDPSYHRARIGLAEAEARLGEASQARDDYARVLADNPPTDEAYKIIAAMDALNPSMGITGAAKPGS